MIKHQRSKSGTSLVSLLVATFIMSMVAIGMMSLMSLNTAESQKTYDRADSLSATRVALDKMGRLIRSARSFGDLQGEVPPVSDPYVNYGAGASDDSGKTKNSNVIPSQVQSGAGINLSAAFPSIGDVVYGPGMPNANLVSGGPWRLSQDCLIIQVQTFDANGFPNRLSAQYAPNVSTPLPAVDTYIYRVVPDTSITTPAGVNWYRLELTCYPAPGTLTNMPPGMQAGVPQVVLSRLVGPTDDSGTRRPAIFQYIDSTKAPTDQSYLTTAFPDDSQNELMIANFKGVVVNLQVMNVDARRRAQVSSVRSEFFLRNNATAAIMVGAND